MSKVEFGVDRVVKNPLAELRTARVGMVTSNAATVAFNGETSRVALRRAGVNLTKLFGPEHGLSATAVDGALIGDERDPATRLPVVSLYGREVRPSPQSLANVDVMLYDIPDVGARFYTYIWTLSHVMEACADASKPLYVLDRPNPIGGDLDVVEGPMLDETDLSTFVGRWNMPIRYSLTIGELARLWNAERNIGCDLRVIPCAGWGRKMHWPALGLRFVPTSPNLPSYETALLYPGTCLIEGTNVSEGRGTDAPFRMIGAPWIDGEDLAAAMNAHQLSGVRIDAIAFTPRDRKFANERCGGVIITCTDAEAVRPVAVGLHLIVEIIRLHRANFEWLDEHFDRLIGQRGIRRALEKNLCDDEIRRWTSAHGWTGRIASYLLYE